MHTRFGVGWMLRPQLRGVAGILTAAAVWLAAACAAHAAAFSIIYTFQGGTDGAYGRLFFADSAGALYGTTLQGGSAACKPVSGGCGTVFKLTPPAAAGGTWTKTELYSFAGHEDGSEPVALVADKTGTIYGTTLDNVPIFPPCTDCGTVFKLAPPVAPGTTWTKTLLHRFAGGSDSASLGALIVASSGALFGVSSSGGTGMACPANCGYVYQLSPPPVGKNGWRKTIVYAFMGGQDGGYPAALIGDASGRLYGSTALGGSPCGVINGSQPDCGSVFVLSPPQTAGSAWTKATLDVNERTIGSSLGGLTLGNHGQFYGSGQSHYLPNNGTIFSVTPPTLGVGAVWHVLYRFSSNSLVGGEGPNSLLSIGKGGLIGATLYGGVGSACPNGSRTGCGTAFELLPQANGGPWKEVMLHSFSGGADGAYPAVSVLGAGGAVFGSTYRGTAPFGTIFQITP